MIEVAPSQSIGEIAMLELEAGSETWIRTSLCAGFQAAQADLGTIENCFKTITRSRGSIDERRIFYRSWSMTNNSAMCVSGQANRLSALALKLGDNAKALLLLKTIASLHRITDEDLAVGSGVLHSDLFYRMATFFSEGDDWLGHRYMQPEAQGFKQWRDRESLHHSDIMRGLLITLVHEIYTHSEVEFILPMFKSWAKRCFHLEGPVLARKLAWISVHCHGTETRHFGHALDAVHFYARATGQDPGHLDISETVTEYLSWKSECMGAIAAQYSRVEA